MASDPTTIGKLRKQGLGDNLNTWGLSGGLNGNFDLLDDAVWGVEVLSLTGDRALTSTNYTTGNEIAPRVHRLSDGGLSAPPTVTIPATQNWWLVNNATGFAVTYSNASNAASIAANRDGLIWTDGTAVHSRTFLDQRDADNVTGALPYTFSTAASDGGPGQGRLRLDSAAQNTAAQNRATTVLVDHLDGTGADLSTAIASWGDSTSPVKGVLWLRVQGDPTRFLTFKVTALARAEGHTRLTVANLASSTASPFADGEALYAAFTPSGSRGDAGSIANAGDGSAGEPGFAFAAETGTGLYRSAAGEISVAAAGAQIGAFNAAGLDMKGRGISNAAGVRGIGASVHELGRTRRDYAFDFARHAAATLEPVANIALTATNWPRGYASALIVLRGGGDHIVTRSSFTEIAAIPALQTGTGLDFLVIFSPDGGVNRYIRHAGSA